MSVVHITQNLTGLRAVWGQEKRGGFYTKLEAGKDHAGGLLDEFLNALRCQGDCVLRSQLKPGSEMLVQEGIITASGTISVDQLVGFEIFGDMFQA